MSNTQTAYHLNKYIKNIVLKNLFFYLFFSDLGYLDYSAYVSAVLNVNIQSDKVEMPPKCMLWRNNRR